ncbi:MAG: chemotaxis protein CheW [Planctomycetota bacterium]|jgi:purine-binding chemotaxis protein CheW|nr:chemotaxis protein CheW [Planctomycetota bacterium]MDP7248521.1 chemotaxis protein CheW [Planctomycetota bacterium]
MSQSKNYCTFYLAEHFLAVDVEEVQEISRHFEVTPVPLSPVMLRGLINLRGQIIPSIDLRHRLDCETTEETREANVVLRGNGSPVSLLVDDIGDIVELDLDELEPPPETLQGPVRDLVRGAFKFENRLLILIDSSKLLRELS